MYYHYKSIITVEPRLPVAYHLHLVITDSFLCPWGTALIAAERP